MLIQVTFRRRVATIDLAILGGRAKELAFTLVVVNTMPMEATVKKMSWVS